ncbi:MAG: hypothetical protein PWQ77_1451 [Kosmotogales bacterium]|nr:hypothetical protein [Kosmotogales bacterium]
MSSLERNLKIYGYFKFCQNMLIIGPILVPFMLYKGLNYSEILLLQSISALSVFIFEVPTGVIADKVSRKFSLVLSSIFMVVGLLFYITQWDFIYFALAETLFGIGLTFSSGSDSAILYESLVSISRKDEYQRIETKVFFNIYIGQAIGSISSSLLYTVSPNLPFYVSFLFMLTAGVISIAFIEPVKMEKNDNSYFRHMIEGFKISLKNPRIRWALYAAAIVGFSIRISYWLYEPYFKGVGIDIAWYGTIFFAYNVVCAVSSRMLIKKFENKRQRKIIVFLGMILGFSFLLPLLFFGFFGIGLIALGQISRGLYRPVMNFYINNQVSDRYRATIISIVSLSGNLFFAIFSPFIGVGLDELGAKAMYLIVGIGALSGTAILWKVRNLQKLRAKKMKAD